MQTDNLKTTWKNIVPPLKDKIELKAMMQESRHPVLRDIRRQMIFEFLLFVSLLVMYYDIFDGDRKPFYANAIFIVTVSMVILLGMAGYVLAKQRVQGSDLIASLNKRLSTLRIYATVFVAGRVFWTIALLIFFGSVITFNTAKYWLLGGAGLVVIIQTLILSGIWKKRMDRLKESIRALNS